jgi:chemotaxis protein CheD
MNPTSLNNERKSADRKVGMGEMHVVQGSGILRTLLGSCIGLILHDTIRCVGGMAHIVLPTSNGSDQLGKYADTAFPELVSQIQRAGGISRSLTAKLAGGANMFALTTSNGIGEQNLAMVEQLLKEARIPVLGRHCGGQQGRKVAFDVQTGAVTVEVVGGVLVEL